MNVVSLIQLLEGSAKLKDKIAGNGDTKFWTSSKFWKISWMKLWHTCASSANNFWYDYFLPESWMQEAFSTNGWKKNSLQWIYNPTDDSVCLFVRFMDTLANFRFQDWKTFGHAPYRDDYGLVKAVGLRLFTVLYFSVQMVLFPGSKFSCKLLSIYPNSWNESLLCDVFSQQFGCVLTDHYFFTCTQATLASTRASRTCTAHTCLQLDWLYQFIRYSIYRIKMCSSRKSRGFIMMKKDKSWKLDRFTAKRTFSLEAKTNKQKSIYAVIHIN